MTPLWTLKITDAYDMKICSKMKYVGLVQRDCPLQAPHCQSSHLQLAALFQYDEREMMQSLCREDAFVRGFSSTFRKCTLCLNVVTGYSSNVYNFKHTVTNRLRIQHKCLFGEYPWYSAFNGSVEWIRQGKSHSHSYKCNRRRCKHAYIYIIALIGLLLWR